MTTPTQRVVLEARRRGVPFLTHSQWGSKQTALYTTRRRLTHEGHWPGFVNKVDTVVLHITVTHDSGVLTGDFKKDCQIVEQIGVDRFGTGMSYNVLVDMQSGMAAVGQPFDSKGAHTVNDKNVKGYSHDQNLVARAIAFVGMPGDKLSTAAIETVVDILMAMWVEGQLTDDPDILPHSHFAFKDCPTQVVRNAIPVIQKRFRARVKREKAKASS